MGYTMLDPDIVALLREAYGDGQFGGWVRERNDLMSVWKHEKHGTVVVLVPATQFLKFATLRILMPIGVGGELKTVAECLTLSGSAPIHLLCGYRLIDPRHTSAYKYGRRAERWGVPRGK
jgi:hypothetical protein